jgi:hypothetical protein
MFICLYYSNICFGQLGLYSLYMFFFFFEYNSRFVGLGFGTDKPVGYN